MNKDKNERNIEFIIIEYLEKTKQIKCVLRETMAIKILTIFKYYLVIEDNTILLNTLSTRLLLYICI